MKEHSWARQGAGWVALALSAVCAGGASAQEVTHTWYRIGTPAPLEYRSERDAQAAIEAMGKRIGFAAEPVKWGVRGHAMTRDDLVTYYGVRPTPLNKGDWSYSYGGNTFTSEEALLASMRSGTASLCPVSVPAPEWVSQDGVGKNPENSTFGLWWKGVTISFVTVRGGCTTPTRSEVTRSRRLTCPNVGYLVWDDEAGGCLLYGNPEATFRAFMSYTTRQSPKQCLAMEGNPCNAATGEKVQAEPELDLPWIQLVRHYHSKSAVAGGGFGSNWTHSHNIRIANGLVTSYVPAVVGLIDEDGSHVAFQQKTNYYLATDGSGDRADRTNDGWIVSRRGELLRFNRLGLLQRREFEDGTTLAYAYDGAGRLKEIRHSTGRTLEFAYADATDEKIAAMTINGAPYAQYTYGAHGQLVSVTHADGLSRTYHYEDARFPWYLTGVTPEDGRRFSWFGYDEKGRVTCSRHDAGCN
ncbi:DUF6531 domain-containing protein [Stenotrophomonas cyclobalanopsidis]|uniref:DUF6531 domain-containing protein n=2 Tax=Stenotrophomonas TaxID=40323 RepID=UPI00345FCC90